MGAIVNQLFHLVLKPMAFNSSFMSETVGIIESGLSNPLNPLLNFAELECDYPNVINMLDSNSDFGPFELRERVEDPNTTNIVGVTNTSN